MGLKLSSLFSKKKSRKEKRIEYSPKTAQRIDNERRTGKLIYPPLSSLANEEPKRSLLPNGRLLYEPVYMDPELDRNDCNDENERYQVTSPFVNNYHQYNDGTFAVVSRQPINAGHIFRL